MSDTRSPEKATAPSRARLFPLALMAALLSTCYLICFEILFEKNEDGNEEKSEEEIEVPEKYKRNILYFREFGFTRKPLSLEETNRFVLQLIKMEQTE